MMEWKLIWLIGHFIYFFSCFMYAGEYSCLSVDLIFKRQFSYYLITIYIPGCMLVIVSWVRWVKYVGMCICKVGNILKGSLDSIPSPSSSVKIQIMGGKVHLRCKSKTLLGIVNKPFVFKSLLTSPSNVLPYYLK